MGEWVTGCRFISGLSESTRFRFMSGGGKDVVLVSVHVRG